MSQQLWQHWDEKVDVFNVNVPLGFKDASGAPVRQEVVRTEVDMMSSYQALYSELVSLECDLWLTGRPRHSCFRLTLIAVCQDAALVKISVSTAPSIVRCSTPGGCFKVKQAATCLCPKQGRICTTVQARLETNVKITVRCG